MANSPTGADGSPRPGRRIAVRFDPTDIHPTIQCLELHEQRSHGQQSHVHIDLVAELRDN
jgi:hypothetical protein